MVIKFHEDIIFKSNGQYYGQDLMEIIQIEGKIVEVHQTEYSVVDPKMYKPDLVFELEDKIIILEFQSSYINVNDKIRFRFYSALFDHLKNKSKKPIEVHVLSTVEAQKTVCYKVNPKSRFPICIHNLKNYNSQKFLNNMDVKINHNKKLSKKELLLISLLCFMDSKDSINQLILKSAQLITNIQGLDDEITQFVKGIVLMLCDKFVDDESLNTTISNLVGGNMKIVEDYAQRKVDEAKKEFKKELDVLNYSHKRELEDIDSTHKRELEAKDLEFLKSKRNVVINLDGEGFSISDIAKLADVSLDFVHQTLSK